MYNQAKDLESKDLFTDIFKNNLIKVAGVRGCHCLCLLETSPYVRALLKWGLMKKENQEVISPLVEDSMMFTSAVGVELLHRMSGVFDLVDNQEAKMSVELTNVRRDLERVNH
jgi:hypothetical protein